VEILGTPAQHGRDVLVSETMRPSSATEQWHDRLVQPDVSAKIAGGMANLAVVEAPNSEMEALAIAVAMREARHLNKSAALLTPVEIMGTSKPFDFAELAARHRETLIALSSDQNGVAVAFEEAQGAALSAAFDDLLAEQKPSGLLVQLGDYPDVFQTAYADRM